MIERCSAQAQGLGEAQYLPNSTVLAERSAGGNGSQPPASAEVRAHHQSEPAERRWRTAPSHRAGAVSSREKNADLTRMPDDAMVHRQLSACTPALMTLRHILNPETRALSAFRAVKPFAVSVRTV
jgi:hypothetical protein